MNYIYTNPILKALATSCAIVIAFIVIELSAFSDEINQIMKITISSVVAGIFLEVCSYGYKKLFKRYRYIRATTGVGRPGRYEGLWIQTRQNEKDVNQVGTKPVDKFALIKIIYDPKPEGGVNYLLRGIAFDQTLDDVSCIFFAELKDFKPNRIDFEAIIRYKEQKDHGWMSAALAKFTFFNKEGWEGKFERWLFTGLDGEMYDTYNYGKKILKGHRLNDKFVSDYDFNIPEKFSFSRKFNELDTSIPGTFSREFLD